MDEYFKLSDQALAALMMALQNSLMNETDIVPTLRAWELKAVDGQLYVENPPIVDLREQIQELNDVEE